MKTWSLTTQTPPEARGAALALGNFDGLHAGHRAVIDLARKAAAETGAPLGVATFDPAPRRHFQPDAPPFRLMTDARREIALAALGVQHCYLVPFDAQLAAMTDREFVERMLVARAGASAVSVGFDFRFGRDRMGDADSLRRLCADFGVRVDVAEKVELGGEKASSTRIREQIEAGDMQGAALALGAAWTVDGVVEHGEKRGRTLGFPTANFRLGEIVHPAFGVYAVWARIDGEPVWRAGVANFGRTPTTGDRAPLLETMIFDFDGDLYGRRLHVAFDSWLRPERRFESLEILVEAMHGDVAEARDRLMKAAPPVGL